MAPGQNQTFDNFPSCSLAANINHTTTAKGFLSTCCRLLALNINSSLLLLQQQQQALLLLLCNLFAATSLADWLVG